MNPEITFEDECQDTIDANEYALEEYQNELRRAANSVSTLLELYGKDDLNTGLYRTESEYRLIHINDI